jgi:hypothetical protein
MRQCLPPIIAALAIAIAACASPLRVMRPANYANCNEVCAPLACVSTSDDFSKATLPCDAPNKTGWCLCEKG